MAFSDVFEIETLQNSVASKTLLNFNVCPQMNALNMEDIKLHFPHIMLYEFRKGVSVGTAKNIQKVYFDGIGALQTAMNVIWRDFISVILS